MNIFIIITSAFNILKSIRSKYSLNEEASSHVGELGTLIGTITEAVMQNRFEYVRELYNTQYILEVINFYSFEILNNSASSELYSELIKSYEFLQEAVTQFVKQESDLPF